MDVFDRLFMSFPNSCDAVTGFDMVNTYSLPPTDKATGAIATIHISNCNNSKCDQLCNVATNHCEGIYIVAASHKIHLLSWSNFQSEVTDK